MAAAEVGEATVAKIIAGARKAADVGGVESDDRIRPYIRAPQAGRKDQLPSARVSTTF